jgi:hypothetical protein
MAALTDADLENLSGALSDSSEIGNNDDDNSNADSEDEGDFQAAIESGSYHRSSKNTTSTSEDGLEE